MDFAYDHIIERSYSGERSETPKPQDANDSDSSAPTPRASESQQRPNLQTEFQETFKAFSNSPWGAKLGGWWSTARKQGESYYETARKEAEKREAEAAKALEDVRKTVTERAKTVIEVTEEHLDNIVNEDKKAEALKLQQQQRQQEEEQAKDTGTLDPDTAIEDNETFINRFKAEAAKRLKEVQKAEDAADEALLRFGANIRNFLKDAVSITAPELSGQENQSSEVLFESKDATTGKRLIHASRFDAQLHVIHTTPTSFTEDPTATGGQWEDFKKQLDIEKKTDAIAKDLETYTELRAAMEKLVPENVDYKDFWTRYYFLRHVVELQEEKRREMLKASTNKDAEEEVGWDEDSDNEEQQTTTAKRSSSTPSQSKEPTASTADAETATLKPSRRSHDEKSVADSDASYDLVSGAASQAAGSPKEKVVKSAGEESDEDWE